VSSAQPRCGERDHHHDPENPAPGGFVDQPAAGKRTDQARDPRPPRPGSNRRASVLLGEARLDDREARRDQQGGAGALENPRGDQHFPAGRERAERRGGGEPEQSQIEDLATPEEVAQGSAGDH
jgi:hypothetical protein